MRPGARIADIVAADALPTDRILRIGTGLAELVAHAHAAGGGFGGLTPATVFLDADDKVYVLDAGRAPVAARQRDDLFALGALLYTMATARAPYGVVIAATAPPSPIEWNPRLPSGLVQIIRAAVHPDPGARFASAGDIAAALDEVRRAPGSLESLLPVHHVSSSSRVKPPPRPGPGERDDDDQPSLWDDLQENGDEPAGDRGAGLPSQ